LALLWDVARASGWELVGIDEESSVWITGVDGDHPVVHVLLGTLALVARSQETTSRVWSLASLQSGGLGVVVVAIAVLLGNVLQDDPPVPLDVHGPPDLGIVDVRWAEVAFRSNPVGGIVWRRSLGGSSVV